MTYFGSLAVLVSGKYHKPFLLCFLPLSTSVPLCVTIHSVLSKSTAHPAAHNFATDMRVLLRPGMIKPVRASLGSVFMLRTALAEEDIASPLGMVTCIGLWFVFVVSVGAVDLR